jgi:cephalosporin-C deacetylase
MTQGVLDKNEFYMRNIYLDAVRTMDVIAQLEEVDPDRIVTYGGSQGGALSIVASALSGRSKKCYTQITSYCALKNRTELGSGILKGAYDYLKRFPQDATTVFDVLSYFDIINMVSLLNVPTDFFMGLAYPICLPHFVYSAYAHANCEKTITMYPFTPHEVPHTYRRVVQTDLLKLL